MSKNTIISTFTVGFILQNRLSSHTKPPQHKKTSEDFKQGKLKENRFMKCNAVLIRVLAVLAPTGQSIGESMPSSARSTRKRQMRMSVRDFGNSMIVDV